MNRRGYNQTVCEPCKKKTLQFCKPLMFICNSNDVFLATQILSKLLECQKIYSICTFLIRRIRCHTNIKYHYFDRLEILSLYFAFII